jgi:hypothetical protein
MEYWSIGVSRFVVWELHVGAREWAMMKLSSSARSLIFIEGRRKVRPAPIGAT